MILDMIQEWFKELLIDGIISNLTGMFDTLNTKVGEIAGEVGMTPAAWNSSIFNMIRNLSETVIVPIAGIILTFVMCYELIQLIIFLPLYLSKFRLQCGLAGGESVQFCFQLIGGRKFGESGFLDLPGCRLEQDDLALKATQEFFLVL